MGFKEEHGKWLEGHLKQRTGEKRGRLERGHGHGERKFLELVWWRLFGNFEGLHPEFLVIDWRGAPYFIDLVWIIGHYKFAIEIKGYGPHVQQMDRIRYRRELNRETYLQIMGFKVISIPYDELVEQPELIISLMKALLSPYLATEHKSSSYTRLERDTLQFAMLSGKPVRPIDLSEELKINRRTAVNTLHSLCQKGHLRPIINGTRISRYEYIRTLSGDWI